MSSAKTSQEVCNRGRGVPLRGDPRCPAGPLPSETSSARGMSRRALVAVALCRGEHCAHAKVLPSCSSPSPRKRLLAAYAEVLAEALDALSGEERMRVYRMLQEEVRPNPEGYEVSGALCNRRPRGRHRSQSTKPPELRFHALLLGNGLERVELAKA